MFVHYTFSSVWVAEWPPFWKIVARSVGHMFSFVMFISHFGFKSGIWLLIAPVPVHCFSITLIKIFEKINNCKKQQINFSLPNQ